MSPLVGTLSPGVPAGVRCMSALGHACARVRHTSSPRSPFLSRLLPRQPACQPRAQQQHAALPLPPQEGSRNVRPLPLASHDSRQARPPQVPPLPGPSLPRSSPSPPPRPPRPALRLQTTEGSRIAQPFPPPQRPSPPAPPLLRVPPPPPVRHVPVLHGRAAGQPEPQGGTGRGGRAHSLPHAHQEPVPGERGAGRGAAAVGWWWGGGAVRCGAARRGAVWCGMRRPPGRAASWAAVYVLCCM